MPSHTTLPAVSIVIIGRNEAEHLQAGIQSVVEMDYPRELFEILYIDSGSTDGSRDIARGMGVRVIEESSRNPSAALARNGGLAQAKHEIIHFMDGDMTIAPSYLKKAVPMLSNGTLACIFGRVIEKHADTNWISNMLNMDWKKKEEGFINAPGGGGTFLKSALMQIGGYNIDLKLSEETDVGIRLRNAGKTIYMLNDTMAVHDYGVNSIVELVKRYYDQGKGRFRTMIGCNVSPELKKWSYQLPLQAGAALLVLSMLISYGHADAALILIALYPALYLVRVLTSDRGNIRKYGSPAFLQSYFYYMLKPVVLLGMVRECISYAIKPSTKKK